LNPQFLQNSLYFPVGLLQRGHTFSSNQKYLDISLITINKKNAKGSKIHQKGSTNRDNIIDKDVIKINKKTHKRNESFFCVRGLLELIELHSF